MDFKFYHFDIDIDIPKAKYFFLQSVNIGEGALGFSGGARPPLAPLGYGPDLANSPHF
jgi:hypothetical protein